MLESIVIVTSNGQKEATLRFTDESKDRIFTSLSDKQLHFFIDRYVREQK